MLSVRTQRDDAMSANAGTTIRQPSTALLTIDSEDRFPSYAVKRAAVINGSYNYSAYDFIITKNESIMNGFFTRLGLSEIVFPWCIPNINLQTNRIILTYLPLAGINTSVMLTLPVGFYKPSEIASALQARIIAADPANLTGTTVIYGNDNDPYFEVDFSFSTGDSTGFFTPAPFQPNPALPNFYQFQNTKQLFDVLGFNNRNSATSANTQLGNATFCQSTRYVDIVCAILTYNQSLKDTTTQVVARDSIARVYLGSMNSNMTVLPSDPSFAPPGTTPGVIYTMYSSPKQIQWIPGQPVPSGLRFQVFDDEGTPLDELFDPPSADNTAFSLLGGDINWSATIQISEN